MFGPVHDIMDLQHSEGEFKAFDTTAEFWPDVHIRLNLQIWVPGVAASMLRLSRCVWAFTLSAVCFVLWRASAAPWVISAVLLVYVSHLP